MAIPLRAVHRDGLPGPGTTVTVDSTSSHPAAGTDGIVVDPRDHHVWPTCAGRYHPRQPGPFYVLVSVLGGELDAWIPVGELTIR